MTGVLSESELAGHWWEGRICFGVIFGMGPDAGRRAVGVLTREQVIAAIEEFESVPDEELLISSIAERCLAGVWRGLIAGQIDPDQAFVMDFCIASILVYMHGEHALEGSGLFDARILVARDVTLPWDRRGFIFEADAEQPVSPLQWTS